MSQIETVFEFAANNGSIFSIFFVIITGYVLWKRTGSGHPFFSRIWTLFFGKEECDVIEIKKSLDTQTALMKFRFVTGLRVRTERRTKDIIAWAHRNDENIADIAACGTYFDLESPKLKSNLPSKWLLLVSAGSAAALFLLLIFGIGGVVVDRAVLRFNQSERWFVLDEDFAKPLFDSPGFNLKECKIMANGTALNSGFSKTEVELLCRSYMVDEINDFVEKTVRSQRFLFLFASGYVAYFLSLNFRWLKQGVKAREMKERLAVLSTYISEEEHY